MSRRRTLFIGVTAVSALGFAVDRLFLGEPSPVTAAATSARADTARKSAPPAASAPPAPEPGFYDPSLAFLQRLEGGGEPVAGSSSRPGRDLFSLTPEMLLYYKMLAAADQEQKARQQGPQPGSPEEFRLRHTLEGTYVGPAGPMAVISGEVLRPGDQIDEFRLIRVEAFEVELRRGRDRVVLELPESAAGPGAPVKPSTRTHRTRPLPAH